MGIRTKATAWMAAAMGALGVCGAAWGQYIEDWNKKIDQNALNDNGVDVEVSSDNGKTYVVGWVSNSSTQTSWRLRVYDEDEGAILDSASWNDGNTTGLRYPHSMAIVDNAESFDALLSTYIYITGESPVSGQNKNIVTLKYVFDHTNDTLSGPTVAWENDDVVNGHDIGWDVASIPDQGMVVVTGSSAGFGIGLDSVTICYNLDLDEQWVKRYNHTQNQDDVTVSVSAGPDVSGNQATVVVAGYSRGTYNDDYLTILFDLDDGDMRHVWRKDTGNAERATQVTFGDDALFVTGWTVEPAEVDTPTYTDFMTLRYEDGNGSEEWVEFYDGPAHTDDAAYGLEYWESGEEKAFYVGGESVQESENAADYKVVRYDATDGSILAWDVDEDGWFDGPANGDDSPYDLAVDEAGWPYLTGFVTRVNSSVTSLDMGSVRFSVISGQVDTGFGPFYYNGSANSLDWSRAIALRGGQFGGTDPDTFITGTSTDTSESQNIRAMKYEDP
jgi:hypothetical protein